MDNEQLIAELQRILKTYGTLPVYVIKTANGVTFWPEELCIDDIEVKDEKIWLT